MKKFAIKVYLIIVTIFMLLTPLEVCANTVSMVDYTTINKIEQPKNLCNEALLSMLYPYITTSIEKRFGIDRQFDLFDANIVSIKRPSEEFQFYIVVEVDTFTGAHNPPGGTATITFSTSPYGTKETNFKYVPQ
ncbi:DUF3888 domain-containing protein [Clostridium sp. UBA6640]|uniref:DUF3888 domain-containing protein n=1 Tax=Clostridium sp. UBA6640 TaxID=1946370 RepID=UPI0025C61CB4|nr:DUF3888 domain-containing protein [Clostridium sp. UBA6640]